MATTAMINTLFHSTKKRK